MMERHFFITAGLLFAMALFFAAGVDADEDICPVLSEGAASALVVPGGVQKSVRQIW